MTGKEKFSSGGGLGRALVRHHNHMIQEARQKGAALRRQQRRGAPLESVTELTDIDVILEQAEEAERAFSVASTSLNLQIDLDGASDATGKREQQKLEEARHASCLRVPRRPPWNANMSVEELDANEKQFFLDWRRSLARLEENEKVVLTPFEKNLDVWRQLWRVLERSDMIVMVVDSRDPLFYRCVDLEAYAQEIDEHKRTMLLLNKADLLPYSVRRSWANYFKGKGILFAFWSAKVASSVLAGQKVESSKEQGDVHEYVDADTKIHTKDELLARLQSEAELIVHQGSASKKETQHASSSESSDANPVRQVVVGFVGYPNVGKSSTINALVGEKRTGVTSTPGKTKHFQTLVISENLVLCDCPGLVFPSFSSSRYEMIASGVLPIDRMTEHREAVQVVANKIARDVIERIYNITLPQPKPYESQDRAPLASELLKAYCSSRGYVGSRGLPDETRAARQILKDYLDGKLPHFEMPPHEVVNGEGDSTAADVHVSEPCISDASSDDENGAESRDLDSLLTDLKLFDMPNGMPTRATRLKERSSGATHKHHKKPQRKKDRAWRVGNDGTDGTPVVRYFQKPAVNVGSVRPSS